MASNRPIGLYDSGLGGLSVVCEVLRQLPGESVLYFGDTARVPYGPRPASEIQRFNQEIVAMLVAEGAKLIVIACNTSCAIALPQLQDACPVPLIGLIRPGAEAALAAGTDIGVIATEGTIRSGAYGRAIQAIAPQARVREVACTALVPLVEAGVWDGPDAEVIVRAALAPFVAQPPECLVLGCTHYPHLAPVIRRVLPGVTLVDPAARAILATRTALDALELHAPEGPVAHRFWVSGDPDQFALNATRLFPGMLKQVVQQLPAPIVAPDPELIPAIGP